MTRYHLINGERVAFTAEEETARDAQEAAWAAEKAARDPHDGCSDADGDRARAPTPAVTSVAWA